MYFTARIASLFGDTMLPVALTAAVLHAGYGTFGVGLVLAASMASWVLLMLFTGVLADRVGVMPMMISADAMRFVVQVVLAGSLLLSRPSLWLIVGLQGVAGIGTALFEPGNGSLVTRITTDVQRANGVLRTAQAMVSIIGPAVGGALLAVANSPAVIAVDGITFLVSGLSLVMVRLPAGAPPVGRGRMLADLVDGWHEFVSRRWLWTVILIFCIFGLVVFGPFLVISASTITEHRGSTIYGLSVAMQGVGGVIGGIAAARIRPRRPLFVAACAFLLYIPQFLVVAVNAVPAFLFSAMAVGGMGRTIWHVLWMSTEQRHLPTSVLNRIYAYDVTGSIMLIPVGRALTGPLVAGIGSVPTLLISTVVAMAGCFTMLAMRGIRRLPAQPAPAISDKSCSEFDKTSVVQ
ncbi:MFS transporter [Actinoplanes subtropicus]|uniref:MFS transporter n=1 Tax=Actinoplanes subtropicus TaxID=543632 RepID=UPI0006905BA3|nr:MFS transporter [Actinoplanes subtropicus]